MCERVWQVHGLGQATVRGDARMHGERSHDAVQAGICAPPALLLLQHSSFRDKNVEVCAGMIFKGAEGSETQNTRRGGTPRLLRRERVVCSVWFADDAYASFYADSSCLGAFSRARGKESGLHSNAAYVSLNGDEGCSNAENATENGGKGRYQRAPCAKALSEAGGMGKDGGAGTVCVSYSRASGCSGLMPSGQCEFGSDPEQAEKRWQR